MNTLARQFSLAALIGLTLATSAQAAGTVRLELIGDTRGSALAFQQWAQALGKAGIENVRIRGGQDSDKVGIETQGAAEHPVYVVTGLVRSDELVLPGGRFRRGEMGRLAQWLHDLAEHGPNAGKEKKAAFGLTAAQLDSVCADLAAPVGFATAGMTRQAIIEKIAPQLKQPLKLDANAARALADDKLDEELTNLACGTALAYVLRSAGYGLLPRAAGNALTYDVVKARPDLEVWPVGWPSEKPAKDALPSLFETRNVNVQNVSAAKALDAIGQRVKAAVLVDHSALAKHGVDTATATVSLPSTRTTYSLALRTLLFQARMKFEVRHDEAGTPFLWVTSLKPQ